MTGNAAAQHSDSSDLGGVKWCASRKRCVPSPLIHRTPKPRGDLRRASKARERLGVRWLAENGADTAFGFNLSSRASNRPPDIPPKIAKDPCKSLTEQHPVKSIPGGFVQQDTLPRGDGDDGGLCFPERKGNCFLDAARFSENCVCVGFICGDPTPTWSRDKRFVGVLSPRLGARVRFAEWGADVARTGDEQGNINSFAIGLLWRSVVSVLLYKTNCCSWVQRP